MKPSTLNRDSNREDLHAFLDRYLAYHMASRFDNCSIEIQEAFLYSCLDNKLKNRCTEKMEQIEDKSVITIETYFGYIREIFDEKIPLFSTRINTWQASQQKGESFSAMRARMKLLWKSSDMNIITEEQLWVLKLINSTRDEVLKSKLLELDDPTEEGIMAKVRSYENATFNQSSLAGTQRALKSNQPTKFSGECGSCKLVGHKSKECKGRIAGRLKCKKCAEMNRPARTCGRSIPMSIKEKR